MPDDVRRVPHVFQVNASFDDVLRRLEHADPAAHVVLDDYVRAVRELRAVARESRERIERAATTVAEAREYARRRRRRAAKAAARRRRSRPDG